MTIEFPAIKYEQGGRTVYAAATRIGDLLELIPERDNPDVISDANRRLFPAHAREFGEYLWETDDWLVGPLMVGISEAEFKPGRGGGHYGTLVIPDAAVKHLFDGQHRVTGARTKLTQEQAAAEAMHAAGVDGEELAEKEGRIMALIEAIIPTIFYVEADVTKLRQMYSDISRVRPPDAITTARFDSRDPFNVGARALAESHPLLMGRVALERNALSATSEELITLNQLAAVLRICWFGPTRRRAAEPDPADVVDRGRLFFDTMLGAFPVLKSIAAGEEDALTARERGDLVASVTMLKVFANIWHSLLFVQSIPPEKVVEYLRDLPATAEADSVYTRAGMPVGAKAPLGRVQVDKVYDQLLSEFEPEEAEAGEHQSAA